MNYPDRLESLVAEYSGDIAELLRSHSITGPRHYGFEYEFISAIPLTPSHMEELYTFLPECGFLPETDRFIDHLGSYITFEPGGQIEYHSLPLLSGDHDQFHTTLELIDRTNASIQQKLHIRYIATGYIAGRAEAPLCLKAERYKNLHKRMLLVGTRGLEMMKGTASIHFHAEVRDIGELSPIFSSLCTMAMGEDFGMQKDRRDIWNNTDPSRCGLPYTGVQDGCNPEHIIEELVRFALRAETVGENVPFYKTENPDYNSFLYHMTTMFTDVRLNLKGPTVELRTMDSVPLSDFEPKWKRFVSLLEDAG